MSPLSWILIAFPFYLFVKGKAVAYIKLAGSGENESGASE